MAGTWGDTSQGGLLRRITRAWGQLRVRSVLSFGTFMHCMFLLRQSHLHSVYSTFPSPAVSIHAAATPNAVSEKTQVPPSSLISARTRWTLLVFPGRPLAVRTARSLLSTATFFLSRSFYHYNATTYCRVRSFAVAPRPLLMPQSIQLLLHKRLAMDSLVPFTGVWPVLTRIYEKLHTSHNT